MVKDIGKITQNYFTNVEQRSEFKKQATFHTTKIINVEKGEK